MWLMLIVGGFSCVRCKLPLMKFLETWKCQGIQIRSGKRLKVREMSGNFCSWGNFVEAAQQNNLLVLYLYVIHISYVMFTDNLD